MTLKVKLLTSKLCLTVAPMVIVSVFALWQAKAAFTKTAEQSRAGFEANTAGGEEALIAAGDNDLTHLAQGVYALCQAQQELLQQKVDADLNVARAVLERTGDVAFAEQTVEWEAVNQYTRMKQKIPLPKMMVGQTWLGQNRRTETPSPVVDRVQGLVGGTCTIFQRMNERGDMLRVSTNVKKLDGERAIGTFIPAVNPDGKPNPVLEAVLGGQTFNGRAYVVNAWYITAYEPIVDAGGDVVGMLYVGVNQDSATSLRKAIMSLKVGQTGYVYVLNARGPTRGHYVISAGGKRDGENIWEARDADGRLFIQDICASAVRLQPGEIGDARYPWQNPGDPVPRDKVVKLAYFAPWDWVIGVGSYEDEFFGAAREMEVRAKETLARMKQTQDETMSSFTTWFFIIGGVVAVIGGGIALLVASSIDRPISRVVRSLVEGSALVAEASEQVNGAAAQLAEASSEQASSLEETSAALEEMSAMTRNNTDNAQQANGLVTQVREAAHQSDQEMGQLNSAMAGINESSSQISKIIKVIEEIAFQTNLLALNAAVEAARAGEHGKGFAVVADEVRSLAQRAADAAGETTALIEQSVTRAKEGTAAAGGFGEKLQGIVSNVSEASDLVNGINRASEEQTQGVEQISTAVSQMDRVTQSIAASAEESASAVEELSAQADSVSQTATALADVIGMAVDTADRKKIASLIQTNIRQRRADLHQQAGGKPTGGTTAGSSALHAAAESGGQRDSGDLLEF